MVVVRAAGEQVRFGAILCGQNFKRSNSPHVWRRMRSNWAKPVQFIGGHIGFYGGSMVPIELGEMVTPVSGS